MGGRSNSASETRCVAPGGPKCLLAGPDPLTLTRRLWYAYVHDYSADDRAAVEAHLKQGGGVHISLTFT